MLEQEIRPAMYHSLNDSTAMVAMDPGNCMYPTGYSYTATLTPAHHMDRGKRISAARDF